MIDISLKKCGKGGALAKYSFRTDYRQPHTRCGNFVLLSASLGLM